jgi:hypothetical protein
MTTTDRIARVIEARLHRKGETAFQEMMESRPHVTAAWERLGPGTFEALRDIWIHGYVECLGRVMRGREQI